MAAMIARDPESASSQHIHMLSYFCTSNETRLEIRCLQGFRAEDWQMLGLEVSTAAGPDSLKKIPPCRLCWRLCRLGSFFGHA